MVLCRYYRYNGGCELLCRSSKVGEVVRSLKWLSIATAIGMFIVVLQGAIVTKTGSGDACGTDWPLCNGKFVPAYTIESMLEYSHRLVSGIVGLLVIVVFIWVWKRIERKDLRLYAGASLFFTMIQAALGAMAVKWSQSDLVMALHFGFSLLAFAGTFLLAIGVHRVHYPAHPSGWGELHAASRPVQQTFRLLVWGSLLFSYVVVYLGAYVRHTESMSGCTGWPTCNGAIIPDLTNSTTAIAFIHRLGALLLFILITYTAFKGIRLYREQILVRNSCIAALIAIVLQVASGAVVVFSLNSETWHLLTGLLHTVIISGLFAILCYLSILVWQLGSENKGKFNS